MQYDCDRDIFTNPGNKDNIYLFFFLLQFFFFTIIAFLAHAGYFIFFYANRSDIV